MVKKIIIAPDERLTTVCEPVTAFDSELFQLVDDLFETMYAHAGVGLAAPQVGVLKQVFVMDCRQGKKPFNPIAFINPEIISSTCFQVSDEEGCLSFPGLHLTVERPARVRVRFRTIDQLTMRLDLRGLEARCFQHELDHLRGVLFSSYATAEELDRAETATVSKK